MPLKKFFNPKSIAIVGASSKKGSVGFSLFYNIINSAYRGKAYPVNHKRKAVQGCLAFKSVIDIEGAVDLAIIATPAKFVPFVLKECGRKRIRNAVVISSGFLEAGPEGIKLFNELGLIAKKYKINLLGPNCLGFLNPSLNLNASFSVHNAQAGSIAVVSQSGALCTSILDWADQNGIGFSYFVSIGSMAHIGFAQLLSFLEKDPKTKSILLYIESIKDADAFLAAARKISAKKPIFALKSGRTQAGAKAAKSHTGALAGNDLAYETAFREAGIVRLDSLEELFSSAKILSGKKGPVGNSLTVLTNAGGPGVLVADACARYGLELQSLEKNTKEKLDRILPSAWSRSNPIDILGDADPGRYLQALRICGQDKGIGTLLVLVTPQSMTDPLAVARAVSDFKTGKFMVVGLLGGTEMLKAAKLLEARNIPVFQCPENAVKILAYFSRYKRLAVKNIFRTQPADTKASLKGRALALLKGRQRAGILIPSEKDAKSLLSLYGIKSPLAKILQTPSGLSGLNFSGQKYVFKVLADNLLHKSDLGGVITNIDSLKKAQTAYRRLAAKFSPKLKKNYKGVLAEKQIAFDLELFIGLKRDEKFGPMVLFGRGGVEISLYNDFTAAFAPLTLQGALDLINRTKVSQVLKGYRGGKKYDIKKLALLIYDFSRLVCDCEQIKELDINPLVPYKDGYIVLDAKMVLNGQA